MNRPPRHPEESARLASLYATGLLDSVPDEQLDRCVRVAARAFGAPMVGVSLVDGERQWFKSAIGMPATSSRDVAFCAHVVGCDGALVVHDTHLDARFAANPLVTGHPGIRFYAGEPVRGPSGLPLGALCVCDHVPRVLTLEQRETLADLAAIVEGLLISSMLASVDPLTGLANRRGLAHLGENLLHRSRREKAPMALVFVDVDRMKAINDVHGHATGDRALRVVADALTDALRGSDLIARIGGDEFCALVHTSEPDAAGRVEQRIAEAVALGAAKVGLPSSLQVSLGSVVFDPDAHADIDALLAVADRRMYKSRAQRSAR